VRLEFGTIWAEGFIICFFVNSSSGAFSNFCRKLGGIWVLGSMNLGFPTFDINLDGSKTC